MTTKFPQGNLIHNLNIMIINSNQDDEFMQTLAAARMTLRFNNLISNLDYSTNYFKQRNDTCLGISSFLDDCLFIYNDGNLINNPQLPTFDEFITKSISKHKLVYGTMATNVICSETLTIMFESADKCSIFVQMADEFESFTNISMNELNYVLRCICISKDTKSFNSWPSENAITHPNDRSLNIFEKFLECIRREDDVYNEQVVRLTTRSVFHLVRWGRYGTYMMATLMMILSNHILHELSYDKKLLCLSLQPKLKIVNNIDLITIGKSFGSRFNSATRYHFHMIIQLPYVPMEQGNAAHLTSRRCINKEQEEFKNSIKALPIEIRHLIMDKGTPSLHTECSCHLIKCRQVTHTTQCMSRDYMIDDPISILFPISSRTKIKTTGEKLTELYSVVSISSRYSQKPDQLLRQFNVSRLFTGSIMRLRIMDRIHFQGNILNMNTAIFDDLRITKSESPFDNCHGIGCFTEVRNPYYHISNKFNDIQLECTHHNEFIPKLSNAKPHYLLFD